MMITPRTDDPWGIDTSPPEYEPMPYVGDPDEAAQPLPGLNLTLLDGPLPEPDWLIPDRIIRRSLTILGAKPGVGKSWLSQSLAVAATTGRPWLDIPILQPFRVLYVDAENGDDLALERMKQLGATSKAMGGRLHYVTASLQLPDAVNSARLRATLDWHRPDLVVVDTLASVAPAAEKDTENASRFLADVWHASRERGASVLLLHHLRKSLQGVTRDDPLDAFRGAGHLAGAATRAWVLEPVTPGKPKFLLRDAKARRGRAQPTLRVQVVDDDHDQHGRPTRSHLEVEGTISSVESGYDRYLAAVLAHIDARPLREASTADLLRIEDAPVERTAKEYLNRATAAGLLHKPRRGAYRRAAPALDAVARVRDDDEDAA